MNDKPLVTKGQENFAGTSAENFDLSEIKYTQRVYIPITVSTYLLSLGRVMTGLQMTIVIVTNGGGTNMYGGQRH